MALVLVLFGCDATESQRRADSLKKRKQQQETSRRLLTTTSRPPRPDARPSDYVGSQACAPCHQEISQLYAQHPMGQSLHPVAIAPPQETFPTGPLDIEAPERFFVQRQGPGFEHRQVVRHADGTERERRQPIGYAVGSGQSGRAYLFQVGAALFQSPLGWYSESACWDLSPGYAPDNHPGFQRRIDDSCLYCHAGRMDHLAPDRYAREPFLEASIGCERCHGPGGRHVALHQRGTVTAGTDQQICNPADLPRAAAADVCNQCHLQAEAVVPRFGRDYFDFRPGDRLEDVFVVFEAGRKARRDEDGEAVTHVEQMRASRCYTASSGALKCTTCHDPHQRPAPEARAELYRQACFSCHDNRSCDLPLPTRSKHAAANSCVACHMPARDTTNVAHAAHTDHRIVRTPAQPPPTARKRPWQVFDGAQPRLPEWELKRAQGLALMNESWQRRDPQLAIEARGLLLQEADVQLAPATLADRFRADPAVLGELAASYYMTQTPAAAAEFWQALLEEDPRREDALGGLALLALNVNQWDEGIAWLEEVIAVAPGEVQWHIQYAHALWNAGRKQDAKRAIERVLQLDPGNEEFHAWLRKIEKE